MIFSKFIDFSNNYRTTNIDISKFLYHCTCYFPLFNQSLFCISARILLSVFVQFDGVFITSKSRKSVFLQPNPVCDFDPWFHIFAKTVMITGSGLKKSYIFRFCVFFRFFDAMILMFPIRFLFDFFWLRGFSPAFWLQLFRRFHFSVNNCILYANSTEISGFSVLLCFWQPSLLT